MGNDLEHAGSVAIISWPYATDYWAGVLSSAGRVSELVRRDRNCHPREVSEIPRQRRKLIRAASTVDGQGRTATPGAVLLEGSHILASGAVSAIGPVNDAELIDRPRCVLLPALVNVHCHLDLSHIGPTPLAGDFVSWIEQLRVVRAKTNDAIATSVQRGIKLALAGGTALVGDIAGVGSLVPIDQLRASKLCGVSFLEVFGHGHRQDHAINTMKSGLESCPTNQGGVQLGLQPHAPYSCGRAVFEAAAQLQVPLATHLAETVDELEFVDTATGPLASMLKRFGVWDDSIVGCGCHPVDYITQVLDDRAIIAAHLNYVDNCHIEKLASSPITVAYCPRASAYFGHPHADYPAHRYRDMLELGMNVALGTDGLPCLDTPDRISVLDEMRFLYQRDSADPIALLRMATVAGAVALGFDQALFTLAPGPTAGLLAVETDTDDARDPLMRVLQGDNAPQWVAGPF